MKSLYNTQNKSELKVLLTNYNLVSKKSQNTHTQRNGQCNVVGGNGIEG